MTATYWSWALSAAAIVALAVWLGYLVGPAKGPLGILVDRRGRFSLTHLQVVVWTIVVLSLVSGVFWGRLIDGDENPLSFEIPGEVLGLLGISLGSALVTGAVKSAKDGTAGDRIAASNALDRPRLGQVFLLEEGQHADEVVDVAKFQNFIITIVLVVAYIALAIERIADAESTLGAIPTFDGTFLTLLGISHATYVAGKLPGQQGQPPGLTVANRLEAPPEELPAGVEPRNPPATRTAAAAAAATTATPLPTPAAPTEVDLRWSRNGAPAVPDADDDVHAATDGDPAEAVGGEPIDEAQSAPDLSEVT